MAWSDWLDSTPDAKEIFEKIIQSSENNFREYQKKTLRQLRDIWSQSRKDRILVALPTGAGKTRIAAQVARFEQNAGRRVVWLVHRQELFDQTIQALAKAGVQHDSASSEIAQWSGHAPRSERSQSRPIHVATIQTLLHNKVRPAASEEMLLVIDEAHHYAAKEWRAVVEKYPCAKRLLLSATPMRTDGISLGIAEKIIAPVQPKELIEKGYLVPCSIVAPREVLGAARIARTPVEAWQTWVQQKKRKNQRTIIFCQSKKHANELCEQFKKKSIQAACITQETQNREEIWKQLKDGELQVVTNVYIGTEGLDIPEIEVCMVARSVSHRSTWIQMVGRVLRTCEGKQSALIIDLNGLVHDFGSPTEDRFYCIDSSTTTGTEDQESSGSEETKDGIVPEVVHRDLHQIIDGPSPILHPTPVLSTSPQQGNVEREYLSFSPNFRFSLNEIEKKITFGMKNSKTEEAKYGWTMLKHMVLASCSTEEFNLKKIFEDVNQELYRCCPPLSIQLYMARILYTNLNGKPEDALRNEEFRKFEGVASIRPFLTEQLKAKLNQNREDLRRIIDNLEKKIRKQTQKSAKLARRSR